MSNEGETIFLENGTGEVLLNLSATVADGLGRSDLNSEVTLLLKLASFYIHYRKSFVPEKSRGERNSDVTVLVRRPY